MFFFFFPFLVLCVHSFCPPLPPCFPASLRQLLPSSLPISARANTTTVTITARREACPVLAQPKGHYWKTIRDDAEVVLGCMSYRECKQHNHWTCAWPRLPKNCWGPQMTTRGAVLPGRIAWEFNTNLGPRLCVRRLSLLAGNVEPSLLLNSHVAYLAIALEEQPIRIGWMSATKVCFTREMSILREHRSHSQTVTQNGRPIPSRNLALEQCCCCGPRFTVCASAVFGSLSSQSTQCNKWSNSQSEATLLRPATRQHPHIIETHSLSPNCTQNPRRTSHWLSLTKNSESLG